MPFGRAAGRSRTMSIKAVLHRTRRLFSGLLGYPDDLPRVGDWSHSRAPMVDEDRVMQSHTHAWLRSIGFFVYCAGTDTIGSASSTLP